MTHTEQIEFVTSLMRAMQSEMILAIVYGKVPDRWDGIELRRWIARRAKDACIGELSGARLRRFNNDILVNDL